MKKKILMCILTMFVLFGCSNNQSVITDESLALNEQSIEQLQLDETAYGKEYISVNYENQRAIWFTMMDYQKALKNKSREEFTDYISTITEKIKNSGFNTIYVHVRPYNNAYYKSEIFPTDAEFSAEYDAFEIIIQKAHEQDLSVHAWINPLRCQTEDELEKLENSYTIKKWYDNEDDYILAVDGRYYLNPAYDEVREYVYSGVGELIENYQIDGIHIDDYFYPTTDKSFDEISFENSGETDINTWRTQNINYLIKGIYDTIKNKDSEIVFGISPQGNIDINKNNLYADVEKWSSESGYCDYIVPQLYYGFKNENKPFKETFQEWKKMTDNGGVKLVAGVCVYKIGSEDKWAGSGKDEWINDKNIPSRQIEYVFENDCSVAVYSMGQLFGEKNQNEYEQISKKLREED